MTPIPVLGPESSLRAVALVPIPDTRKRRLEIAGPPGFRLDAVISLRAMTLVQHTYQMTARGIVPIPQKIGTVSLVRPLPKTADADEALALLQESLTHGLHQVDQILDAAARTLKALARRGSWMNNNRGSAHLYLAAKKSKSSACFGGSYVPELPRLPAFALDRIFAGKIAFVKGQIRPVRGTTVSVRIDAIPTSRHARLPLLADALRAWSALGYDAAEWLVQVNDLAERHRD
jgi:hypothetical protein